MNYMIVRSTVLKLIAFTILYAWIVYGYAFFMNAILHSKFMVFNEGFFMGAGIDHALAITFFEGQFLYLITTSMLTYQLYLRLVKSR